MYSTQVYHRASADFQGEAAWPPWNHFGTWKSNCGDGNYFILGGYRDGVIFLRFILIISSHMGYTTFTYASFFN